MSKKTTTTAVDPALAAKLVELAAMRDCPPKPQLSPAQREAIRAAIDKCGPLQKLARENHEMLRDDRRKAALKKLSCFETFAEGIEELHTLDSEKKTFATIGHHARVLAGAAVSEVIELLRPIFAAELSRIDSFVQRARDLDRELAPFGLSAAVIIREFSDIRDALAEAASRIPAAFSPHVPASAYWHLCPVALAAPLGYVATKEEAV